MNRKVTKPNCSVAIGLWASLACAVLTQGQPPVNQHAISPPYSLKIALQPKLWEVLERIPLTVQCHVQDGKAATVEVTVKPYVKVEPTSAAANLEVHPALTNLPAGVSRDASVTFGLTIKDAGEFIVRFALVDETQVMRASQSLFIISRDGKVSVSGSDFRICEWQFLMSKHGLPLDATVHDLPAEKKDLIQNEYRAIRRDRRVKEEEYDRLHLTSQQPAVLNAVPSDTKSGKKIFQAFWTATIRKKLFTVKKKLSIVGAKVEVFDCETGAVLTNGTLTLGGKYSDNLGAGGTFEFDDPGVKYKVRIIPKYEGGTVGGSAVGKYDPFEVVDKAGNAYDEDFVSDTNATEYTAPPSDKDDIEEARRSGVWEVYHGVLDVAKGAKDLHNLEKGSAFYVYFPISGTYTCGTNTTFPTGDDDAFYWNCTSNVYIGWNHRADWDTLAHEYSHLIDAEYNIVDSSPGGKHSGTNQYSYPYTNNLATFKKKGPSLRLAMSEAFASWFGVGVTVLSPFKGLFPGVGDEKYQGAITYSLEQVDKDNYYRGEDTEIGVQRLMWDWCDSANNETMTVSGVKVRDRLSLGHAGLLDAMKNKKLKGIHELWLSMFLPGGDVSKFNQQAADAAESLVFFGISPVLTEPKRYAGLDLTASPPNFKFKWVKNQHTGSTDLDMNVYRLVLFNSDFTKIFLDTLWLTNVFEYDLTAADVQTVTNAMGGTISDIKAVVFGRNTLDPETGPYASNVVDIRVQGSNRFVVIAVDSSGSMRRNDPTDLRKVAAKETIRRLVSQAEAQAQKTVPDRVAAIDFDHIVTRLSGFADPPDVEPTIDRIDSSGDTDIAAAIDAAVDLLEEQEIGPWRRYIQGKAVICVFTDGENNAGPLPVKWAIARAKAKGIRVHYGLLQPRIAPAPFAAGSLELASARDNSPLPSSVPPYATIEEAVLASGGIYGEIGDAETLIAFVDQIFRAGLTASDPADSGWIVGQTKIFGRIDDPRIDANYYFVGQAQEQVTITVTGLDFDPEIYLVDRTGAFIGMDKNYEGDSVAEISLDLPYTGMYNVRIFSKGGGTGRFNIFVDVQNPPSGIIQDVTAYTSVAFRSWTLDRSSGALVGELVLSNHISSPKILRDAFWYALPATTNSRLAVVDGTTPAGVPYVDLTARVLAALPAVGNGDTRLDPGEEVAVPGISIFSWDLSIPEGTLYSLWADPPEQAATSISLSCEQPQGFIRLDIQGKPRTVCIVEASDDLVHWRTVFMTVNETGAVRFIDWQASQYPHRFYRVRSQ